MSWRQVSTQVVSISAPSAGQVLQGIVAINGNTAVEGFSSAELSFAYRQDITDTWFLIQQIDQPVADSLLAQWDTTAISDGVYDLQLVVNLQDGQKISARVNDLRVRNYSPIETDTPTLSPPTLTPMPSGTPTPTSTTEPIPSYTHTDTPELPTVTPLPTNPARLTRQAVANSLGMGALTGIGIITLLGIYALARSLSHHR